MVVPLSGLEGVNKFAANKVQGKGKVTEGRSSTCLVVLMLKVF